MSEETSSAPGRRRKRSSSPRSNQVLVRLSDEEYERVAAGAAATNLTVPAYLARRGQEEIAPVPSGGQRLTEAQMRSLVSELYALKRILSLSGNNLNQIARVANSTGEVADETVHYAALIARTLDRLERFVAGLRRWLD